MFTVKVIDRRDGKPVKDKKVSVCFEGFFRGKARINTPILSEKLTSRKIMGVETSTLVVVASIMGRLRDGLLRTFNPIKQE